MITKHLHRMINSLLFNWVLFLVVRKFSSRPSLFNPPAFFWLLFTFAIAIYVSFDFLIKISIYDSYIHVCVQTWMYDWCCETTSLWPVSVHAISKASSLIGDMTCLIYPTQLVAEGIMFLTRPSSLSVRLSCFSCQRNSSETAQQNFIKLCSYEEHNVHRKFWFIFFLGIMPFWT